MKKKKKEKKFVLPNSIRLLFEDSHFQRFLLRKSMMPFDEDKRYFITARSIK
jgi:hypothetical protein